MPPSKKVPEYMSYEQWEAASVEEAAAYIAKCAGFDKERQRKAEIVIRLFRKEVKKEAEEKKMKEA